MNCLFIYVWFCISGKDGSFVYACVYTHTRIQSHKLFQVFSFNVVSDIQFFDMHIEDTSICEGTFFLSVEYYTDNGSILDLDVTWYVRVTWFVLFLSFLFYTLLKINNINVHWGMFLCICTTEASKSHGRERNTSQTSQHPWPFPHICSPLPTHACTQSQKIYKAEKQMESYESFTLGHIPALTRYSLTSDWTSFS